MDVGRLVVVGELGEVDCGTGVKLKERDAKFKEQDVEKLKREFYGCIDG